MSIVRFSISFLVLILLSGCFDDALVFKRGKYPLGECKKELKVGRDFSISKKIDKIVVSKSKRMMYLYRGGKKVHSFRVSLGKNPKGHKIKRGDRRTPVGSYSITRKSCNPKYYRMIYLSYPNKRDRDMAKRRGVSPGGGITIHAQPFWNADGKGDDYTLKKNWTNGCIAISNSSMDILWYTLKVGTPIEILK
ncbi:ErfK/YbiS/YcfS/YnhG family protein [hydrothermal vent metagenome]|uniref:ErfK/YbiS/YcfS/YnhG family protein n=1 Tax=hydrothermal vent metagenome TaxID=652676 RepID=A0A1W1CFW4_9ZZZZ